MKGHAKRRAENSLSHKKFLARLNKGLPIFVAYGDPCFHCVSEHTNVRNIHWVNLDDGGFEAVDETHVYNSGYIHHGHMSLNDMNVDRNTYNYTFVFRTQWAAEKYLAQKFPVTNDVKKARQKIGDVISKIIKRGTEICRRLI